MPRASPTMWVTIVGIWVVWWRRLYRVLAYGHVRRGVAGVVGLSIGHPSGCRPSIGHCWAVGRSIVDWAAWYCLWRWVGVSAPESDFHLQPLTGTWQQDMLI